VTVDPRVSVIIAAYRSHLTIGSCLAALAGQSLGDFEVIVVDSSPDDATSEAVRSFPAVRLERAASRLLPQAARNRGAGLARGSLFAFTDPDVYPEGGWLERLVATRRREGDIVVGALACHGRRWLDTGIHICKFSPWLPGGAPREVDMAPTAGLLVSRSTFLQLGGFPGEAFQGDAVFAWRARRRGHRLLFEPSAVARHHHLATVGSFLRERFERGRDLAELRATEWDHSRARDLLFIAVSLLPVRLARVMAMTGGRCWRAGTFATLLLTSPVVVAGHLVGLIGEGMGFGRDLSSRRRTGRGAGRPGGGSEL